MNQCPPGAKYSFEAVSNFFENSRRYLRMNVYHRCHDTGNKYFVSVNDTSNKTVFPIPACLDLKMENKLKFNIQV
jgi:hypothetical protein